MRPPLPSLLAAFLTLGCLLPAAPTAPTEAESEEYGRRLAGCFTEGEVATLVEQLDTDAFLERVTTGLGFNPEELQGFRKGMTEGLGPKLEHQFATFTEGRFLRLQEAGGEKRPLVRVLSAEGAVNYFAFSVHKDGDGRLRWSDCFIYLAGETMSESSRRTVLPLLGQMRKGVLGFLNPEEAAYAQAFPQVHKASQLMQTGRLVEAWHLIEPLPDSVKQDRTVLMIRLQLAQSIDDTKYLRVIQDWEKAFPDDASLDLIAIDGDFMRKDYRACLRRVASLDRRVGGDPYLHLLAANLHLELGEYDEARRQARQVLAEEETLYGAYDTLLGASLRRRQYDETVAELDEFAAKFPNVDVDAEIVQGDDAFGDFRRTPEYQAWQAARRAPSAAASAE
jgi:tetratricopeptide (TPR) repeat protein